MKNIKYIPFLLSLLIVSSVQAQSARQFFKAGEDFAEAKNYVDAIAQFTRALELDPDYDKAYIERAHAYARSGEHKNAAEDYDRALVFDQKDAELFYLSGNEWHLYGNNPLALERLSMAIEIKNNYQDAYRVRWAVNMALLRYEEALLDAKRCLKFKDDERAYYNLAQVYEKLQMYDEAVEAYRNSLQKNSKVVATHYSYAQLLFKLERYPEAGNELSQVIQMQPQHLEAIILQSQVLSAQGKYLEASEILSMASVYYSEEPLIYIYRGDNKNGIYFMFFMLYFAQVLIPGILRYATY